MPHSLSRRQNILIMMLDDVGFADFGCYGSEIETPVIDALAERGVRYTGFHTTAMCSTTRASLHTGRNHHSVGMGCLANFDSGYPGYRGKIDADAPTIAEVLRPAGFRNYFIGKWHVTPLTQSGPTGPFDGWPLGRGFDRFYGFLAPRPISTRRSWFGTTATSSRQATTRLGITSPQTCSTRRSRW